MKILIPTIIFFIIGITIGCEYKISSFDLLSDKTQVDADVSYQYPKGITLKISRNGKTIQTIRTSDNLGATIESSATTSGITFSGYGRSVMVTLEKNDADYAEFRVVRKLDKGQFATDCLTFEKDVYWYGGPQSKNQQYWPINRQNFTNFAYVTKELESTAVTERYWLNSNGVFVFVDKEAPLFITQSPDKELCLSGKKEKPYNTEAKQFTYAFRIGVAPDPKQAHLKAVQNYLGKPTAVPDRTMVEKPIWSTWAKYKKNINAQIVEDFANEINANEFTNSQLEIDDDWETCYGSLKINTTKFPNMKELTDKLKAAGFRVTLWIHPFINKGCDPLYTEALTKEYLVKNSAGSVDTKWWNTEEANQWAAYIDFTKPEAAQWFVDRLNALKTEGGFDSFKFDAGETSWAPADPVLQGDKELHPGWLTTSYINTVKQFGDMVEVRAGQGNQDMPIFMRMIDKDTYWGYNNGLVSLVTTLLQLNMAGYPFVLPDMIGGNGYNSTVTKELFIRWLQANVFMPSLQYSYVPWEFDDETVTISKRFNDLHATSTDIIMNAMAQAVEDGTPVNKPIWWAAPTDPVALGIGDEFLLGDTILAAPILVQGQTSRQVYLPLGRWKDGNKDVIHTGPIWVTYEAPLETLPYFVKQ